MKTVLAFGASGLVGAAAADFFFRAGWRVITCSKRRPMLLPKKSHEHLQLDIIDSASFSEILSSPEENVSHVVEAAVQELPDLIPCWSDPEQIALNREMVVDVIEPLLSNNSLEHISLL